jgi:hypothetical protein
MYHKYHWLYFFIPSIFVGSYAQDQKIYVPNLCYNERYKGRSQRFWILKIIVRKRKNRHIGAATVPKERVPHHFGLRL